MLSSELISFISFSLFSSIEKIELSKKYANGTSNLFPIFSSVSAVGLFLPPSAQDTVLVDNANEALGTKQNIYNIPTDDGRISIKDFTFYILKYKKNEAYYQKYFLYFTFIYSYLTDDKDICLDIGICKERLQLNTKHGFITINKEMCLKYN